MVQSGASPYSSLRVAQQLGKTSIGSQCTSSYSNYHLVKVFPLFSEKFFLHKIRHQHSIFILFMTFILFFISLRSFFSSWIRRLNSFIILSRYGASFHVKITQLSIFMFRSFLQLFWNNQSWTKLKIGQCFSFELLSSIKQ